MRLMFLQLNIYCSPSLADVTTPHMQGTLGAFMPREFFTLHNTFQFYSVSLHGLHTTRARIKPKLQQSLFLYRHIFDAVICVRESWFLKLKVLGLTYAELEILGCNSVGTSLGVSPAEHNGKQACLGRHCQFLTWRSSSQTAHRRARVVVTQWYEKASLSTQTLMSAVPVQHTSVCSSQK